MNRTKLFLTAAISLGIATTSYAKTGRGLISSANSNNFEIKLPTDTADIPEIAEASITGDILTISLLVPAGREPDSLAIRSVGGTWTGANLIYAYTSVSWPYTDTYGRRCWIFQIPLTNFATPGDSYVLRFKDFYGVVAEDYLIYY